MSEGSRRCYHVGMWRGGVAKKGVKLSRMVLHFVAFGEGERTHRSWRGGDGFMPRVGARGQAHRRNHHGLVRPHKRDENGLAPRTGNHKGLPLRGGGRGGRMASCLRRNDGWGAGMTDGARRGKGMDSCLRVRAWGMALRRKDHGIAKGMETGWRRERATTRVAPTGRGRGREDGFLPPQE